MRALQILFVTLLCAPLHALGADWLVDGSGYRASVSVDEQRGRIVLENGLIRRVFSTKPGGATIALDLLATGQSLLRTVKPEARLVLDGETVLVGGIGPMPVGNYVDPDWLPRAQPLEGALRFTIHEIGPIRERFAWKPRPEWMSREAQWPPKGVELSMRYEGEGRWRGLSVVVRHECYDGLPLVAKRLVLENRTGRELRLQECVAEILGVVEVETDVETPARSRIPGLHVETDATAFIRPEDPYRRPSVRWLTDPTYTSQVNYALQSPCLLETAAPFGPDALLADGTDFESHRTWVLPFDSEDTQRRSLTLARYYRTVAPWVEENPLIFHSANSDPVRLKAAIDQAAEVGFEMVIMTFGSGANLESREPKDLAAMKECADYAHAKHVALGGYSLLASRSVNAESDVVDPKTGKPGGAFFGNSPCLGSPWGIDYLAALRGWFGATGCDVLEHDGSYPGDLCGSTAHPGHRGHGDSYWAQRAAIVDFYTWCRGRGIYLNVPDWYFLNGASKTGMGYRETNWSLPREYQEVIERQNIADGVRTKAVTMGWMFVPLMEYQGGGPAATIEPLSEHLDHYRMRFRNLLGAGVQACWRGPRLYDTDATRAMVAGEVAWFRANRRILESDLVLLRRADGADWDGWLHVDPSGDTQGLAMLYNPRPEALRRTVRLPLHYTGLAGRALAQVEGHGPAVVAADESGAVALDVELPPRGSLWVRLSSVP
ncbi:MAG: alpha-galactosidase [Planctomycetota bacterium]|nr:alpha-galactosidase [Planctomycetota bacterium]